jgi:hypothetical protein
MSTSDLFNSKGTKMKCHNHRSKGCIRVTDVQSFHNFNFNSFKTMCKCMVWWSDNLSGSNPLRKNLYVYLIQWVVRSRKLSVPLHTQVILTSNTPIQLQFSNQYGWSPVTSRAGRLRTRSIQVQSLWRAGSKPGDVFAHSRNIVVTQGNVQLSLCLTKHHAMKTYWGNGGTAPCILDLGTTWRWVVSFTSRPLYPQGKYPWYPLDRKLGEPQSRSGRGGEEKNSQPPPGIEP